MNIEIRVSRLDREVRWWRRMAAAVSLFGAFMLGGAMWPGGRAELVGSGLSLTSADGTEYCSIETEDEGPRFVLRAKTGQQVEVQFQTEADESRGRWVDLSIEDGEARVSLVAAGANGVWGPSARLSASSPGGAHANLEARDWYLPRPDSYSADLSLSSPDDDQHWVKLSACTDGASALLAKGGLDRMLSLSVDDASSQIQAGVRCDDEPRHRHNFTLNMGDEVGTLWLSDRSGLPAIAAWFRDGKSGLRTVDPGADDAGDFRSLYRREFCEYGDTGQKP